MAESTQDPERLISEYANIWNDREYAKISDVVSESFVRASPVTDDDVRGPDGLKEHIRRLDAGFPDFQVSIDTQLLGDNVVMAEGTFTGTHDGEFNDVPPTGREVEVRFMDKLRIEGGELHEHRTYYDQQEMLDQLGLGEE